MRTWTEQDVADAVAASTATSGVPLRVQDPQVLSRVALVVTAGEVAA